MSQAAYEKKVQLKTTTGGGFSVLPGLSAEMALTGDVLDDTDFNTTGIRSRLLGLREWTITVNMNFESTNAAFAIARNAWLNRTKLDIQYLPNGTVGFQGQGFVETFSHSGDVGGLETVDLSIVSAGTLSTV